MCKWGTRRQVPHHHGVPGGQIACIQLHRAFPEHGCLEKDMIDLSAFSKAAARYCSAAQHHLPQHHRSEQSHPSIPLLKTIIKIMLRGLLCGKRKEMLCPTPCCWSPASPDTPLLPLLQLTYLPPPWGECRSSDMGLDFFPVYSITACRIDCETRYIVENCNCKMVHMPG